MLKVLIAEDEPLSLQNLSGQMRDLLGADALIEGVANGREAVERARQIQPQLVLMDIRLVPQKRNPYFVGEESVSLYFEEEPIFSCLTAAACATEETESVSGDSYSFLETDDSVAMILSDGVGSGESAERQDCRLDGADIGCGAWTGYGDAFFKWDGRRGGGRKPDGDA